MDAIYIGDHGHPACSRRFLLRGDSDYSSIFIGWQKILLCLLRKVLQLCQVLCNSGALINLKRTSFSWQICTLQAAVCNLMDGLICPLANIRFMEEGTQKNYFNESLILNDSNISIDDLFYNMDATVVP